MLRTGAYGDQFGAPGHEGGLSLAVLEANPHGVDLGALQPAVARRVEDAVGHDRDRARRPCVADVEARLIPSLDRRANGEMVLVGRRDLRSNNSWMHNVEILVKGKPRCTLQIHPDDAARFGVTDGAHDAGAVRVGEVELAAEVTDGIMAGRREHPARLGSRRRGRRHGRRRSATRA